MLFLGIAEKVGRHTELGFDLLLAIAEVVVRNDGDNDAPFVARGDLERRAVVVGLVGRFPAHAIAALAFGGLVPGRQAQFGLGQLVEMGGKNHAARVTTPMLGIERRIVIGKVRVTGIAENAFHEVQIADKPPGHEETDFHAFLRSHSGDLGANHRAEEKGDETLGRVGQGRSERQTQ